MEFENYSELMQYIDNNNTKYLIQYNDFAVVEINDEYWYFEQGENDCDEFCKVELVAQLDYNTHNDLKNNGEDMFELFDCDYCGETDIDDNGNVSYLWFKKKEQKRTNGMSDIRYKVIRFMEHQKVLTELEDENWYSVEDDLTEFIKKLLKGYKNEIQ